MHSVVTLSDVCEEVVDCVNRTAPETEGGSFFAVGTPAMRGNMIDLSQARRISAETFAKWTRRLVPCDGDLLLAREAPVGPVVRIPPGGKIAAGQRTMHLRANPKIVHPRYLFYLLISPDVQSRLMTLAMGSTVPHLRVADIRSFTLPTLPSMGAQAAVQEVLGALDDKIAVNIRTIHTAGQLASVCFGKFFENGDSVNLVRLGELAEVIDCLHSKKPDPAEGGERYLVLADIREDSRLEVKPKFAISEDDYVEWTRRFEAREGDCVITNVGRVGAVGQVPHDVTAAIGRNMTGVRGREGCPPAFLVEALRSSTVRKEIEMKADQGTIMTALNVRTIPDLLIPAGEAQSRQAFQERIGSLHRLQDQLLSENAVLVQARDTLLPKLMSGQIPVRQVEKAVEDLT